MDGAKTIFDVSNGQLIVKTPRPLTDEQRQHIRDHKPEILARLRIEKLAPAETDIGDLMDWYKNDFEIIAALDDIQVGFLITDYVQNRAHYRSHTPT